MEKGSLSVFYKDDNNQDQGPFSAQSIEAWVDRAYFENHHVMRFTDNGCRVGDAVTFETNLQGLKQIFGEEKPIPLTVAALEKVGITGFRVPEHHFVRPEYLKTVEIKQEISEGTQSQEASDETSGEKSPESSEILSSSPASQNASLLDCLEKIVEEEDDSDVEMYAGPSLPPNFEKSSEEWEKKLEKHNPTRDTSRDSNRKFKKSPLRTSSRSEHPYLKKKSKKEKKLPKNEHRPFYDNSSRKDEDAMSEVIAIEFGKLLSKDFLNLNRVQRLQMFDEYERNWKVPKKCKECMSDVHMASNYISHVISAGHIKKMMMARKRVFTFQSDYMPLRKLISDHSSPSNSSDENTFSN